MGKLPFMRQIASPLFILVFLYTGADKLLHHDIFEKALLGSQPLKDYATLLSWAIPAAELVIVFLLFIPRSQKLGLILSGVLMLAFTLYIIYMLVSDQKLPCNCGGIISSLSWNAHLLLNITFLLLAAFSVAGRRRPAPLSKTSYTGN